MKDVKLGGGLQLISNELEVKIKKLVPEATVPAYSRAGDAGLDLTATSMVETKFYIEYGTGLSIAIPSGFVGLMYPRSSLSNYHLILANHVGVIDSNYRGEIKFRFKKTQKQKKFVNVYGEEQLTVPPNIYKVGDRIGQIIIQEIPEIKFQVVEELDDTNRGDKGYGSSGA